MDFASEEAKGLAYIPSMGVGVLIAAPLLTLAFIALGQAPFQLNARAAALPGILAGIIWNAGNVSSPTLSLHLKSIHLVMHTTEPGNVQAALLVAQSCKPCW